ncbi:hypothetical protein RA307_31680, partial [Xanthobacteraceae bacterium Astr-EGSB]|uniref:hypothetical protein n=1 Tax=Astrobacterium formosum TaxID=3069710 RepID=UPI0027B839E2|nr:hypothetical protein [Xanthobacteraceae bacterium Astr-EGSB]
GWVPSGTGASLSVIASNLAITNGAAVQAAGLWDLATAAGVLYKFTAALIDRSDGAAAQARVVEVGGGSAALCLVTAAEGGGANTQYFVAVSSTSRIQLFTGSGSLGVVSQWNSISTRAIPGYAARQGTAALKPIWRSAFGGYADHDESDDVLPQTYPAAFTGDIMLLKPDGSILEWTGQNITTTFNPPGVDQKELVVRSTMQVREKQALAAWMRGRPLA